jgi:hypothetical protein
MRTTCVGDGHISRHDGGECVKKAETGRDDSDFDRTDNANPSGNRLSTTISILQIPSGDGFDSLELIQHPSTADHHRCCRR